MRFGILAAALLALSGCATITEGSTQLLSIDSDPQGARCELFRDGVAIGSSTTPGAMTIGKSKKDISVTCKKPGYEDGTGVIRSDVSAAFVGNVLIGGAIGVAIDASSGAANKYENLTFVSLTPKPGQPIPSDPPATPSAALPPAVAPAAAFPVGVFGAPVGTEYHDGVNLGTMQLPLLEGTWVLAGKGTRGDSEHAASLVRIENGRLWGIIRVWTAARPSSQGFGMFRPCGRTDLLFVAVASNIDHADQDCWALNHYDMRHARATSTQQHMLDSYAFLDNRGVAVPDMMIVGIHRIATPTNFVTVWYQVNPEIAGFPPSSAASWEASEWHRDRLAVDPKRVSYVESFKQTHTRYQELLKSGFPRLVAGADTANRE